MALTDAAWEHVKAELRRLEKERDEFHERLRWDGDIMLNDDVMMMDGVGDAWLEWKSESEQAMRNGDTLTRTFPGFSFDEIMAVMDPGQVSRLSARHASGEHATRLRHCPICALEDE